MAWYIFNEWWMMNDEWRDGTDVSELVVVISEDKISQQQQQQQHKPLTHQKYDLPNF